MPDSDDSNDAGPVTEPDFEMGEDSYVGDPSPAEALGPSGGSVAGDGPEPTSPPSLTELEHPDEVIVPAVIDHFETAPMPALAPAPNPEYLRERFFSFEYLDNRIPTERYWINKPYAFVTIVYDHGDEDLQYRVVEPSLDEFEAFLLADLKELLRDVLLYESIEEGRDAPLILSERATELINEYARDVAPGTLYKIHYYLQRDFLGFDRIDPLMRDRMIEDISCDGVDVPVFVYHREYRDLETNISFEKEPLASFIVTLAQKAGKQISIANPMGDASLSDGSRVQLTLGEEVSTRGSNFTVRRFTDVPITPVDLIAWNTFSPAVMAYIWLLLENNMSLLIAGGTASGKTTSLNAASFFVPPKSKVITIEDTREITLPHENWIQSVTRESFTADGQGEINMYQLLQAALRQRPEYLLVGEIRTQSDVAHAFFQALATGHTACTTFHADSVSSVISRLQNPPLSVPQQMVQELDAVCVQRQLSRGGARVRRNTALVEIGSGDESNIDRNRLVEWNSEDDSFSQLEDSWHLEEIRRNRGWSAERAQSELARRKEFLLGLVERDVRGYEDVVEAIQFFQRQPEKALQALEAGDLASETGSTVVDPERGASEP